MGKIRARLLPVLIPILGGLLLFAHAALAHHAAGTYTGTFTDVPDSSKQGTVSFTVSGNIITNFTARITSPATGCPSVVIPTMAINVGFSDHRFAASAVSLTASGSFPSDGRADGFLRIRRTLRPACNVDPVWRASLAAAATTSPSPGATVSPLPSARIPSLTAAPLRGVTLPRTGDASAVIALSGLSLVEIGVGLRLLSRRLGGGLRSIPTKLLRKLERALRQGQNEVNVTDDWYLVRRSHGPEGPRKR